MPRRIKPQMDYRFRRATGLLAIHHNADEAKRWHDQSLLRNRDLHLELPAIQPYRRRHR